jgi:hypothetical protein
VYIPGGMGLLQALDKQFPPIDWGATPEQVHSLFPGGRIGPGSDYAVEATLVGYPYPLVLFFGFDPVLSSISVEYPRSFDLVTGDMHLPGRMVAESIYRHLSALLIIAFGGAPRSSEDLGPADRGDAVLADHVWTTRTSDVRLEFRLVSGFGRVRVEMRARRA